MNLMEFLRVFTSVQIHLKIKLSKIIPEIIIGYSLLSRFPFVKIQPKRATFENFKCICTLVGKIER